MDIAPGQTVTVEITRTPMKDAARKTLVRLFRKDEKIARAHRRNERLRPSWETWRRGGRMWHHQMKSHPPIPLKPGDRLAVLATVDVIRDLQSVSRWVRVTAK
jgi:hypothetical protein